VSSRPGTGEAAAWPDGSKDEDVTVPRSVRFPVELIPPEGFDPARLETWPRVDGRLEWVGGRLLWMPPCGEAQQVTVADVVLVLGRWAEARPDFSLGTNEAGMRLGDDSRGADAGIWRRRPGPLEWGFRREPPLLAVEVEGRDEGLPELREKARWYLAAGTPVIWIVLPSERAVVVVTAERESRHDIDDRLPVHPALPGLEPAVAALFRQASLDAAE
jgi:Uma2 family endonuclease